MPFYSKRKYPKNNIFNFASSKSFCPELRKKKTAYLIIYKCPFFTLPHNFSCISLNVYFIFPREKFFAKRKENAKCKQTCKNRFYLKSGGGAEIERYFFPQNSKLEFSLYVSLKNVVKLKS